MTVFLFSWSRFDALQTRCEERGKALDNVVTSLTELHAGVRQVDTWIGATVNALKHDRDPNALKNRVEGLPCFLMCFNNELIAVCSKRFS